MMTIEMRILWRVAVALLLADAATQAQTNSATSTNQASSSTNQVSSSTNQVSSSTNQVSSSTNQVKSATAAPAKPPPAVPTNGWKSSVAVGFSLARGNADTTLASFAANTQKKWTHNDLMFGADGLYGKTRLPNSSQSQTTAETLHGFSQYNRSLGDGFYAYARADGFHDGVADIKYRLTLAPGIGYYFVTNKTVDLSLECGPGYIKEQLDGKSESFATLRAAQRFHYAISPHAKVWDTVEFLPQADHLDNYIVNAELGVESALTKNNKLNLRTVLQDSYNNVPAAGRLKNDLKLIAALAYKF
jgi:putative salt-induced outer membrane protein YdiY